ncbi:killer toxin, kp4 [Trichoderma arundinaceum]|uniref:Killer toxin, kp4 n=1 Tax=Trichoderma arundinaceum TaxID=490622 RepID=A0A395NV44_TRIAR|nr:killer toxin, kp4 [Trichoderma arundinaceum]
MIANSFIVLASAFTMANALGINCQGSGLCTGNNGLLGQALGVLRGMDPNESFTDGQHITCQQGNTVGNPYLCIFYQKTGRSWTVDQTISYVQELVDHGCSACGSVPTDPGNNVDNGELTANMVAAQYARRGMDIMNGIPRQEHAKNAVKEQVSTGKTKRHITGAISARTTGINCNGSSNCGVGGLANTPAGTLQNVRDAVAAGDDGEWTDGQHIACVPLFSGNLCAFYQNVGGRYFDKDTTVSLLDDLLSHGCRVCGSIPTDAGNNVNNGELTVNYV